MCWAETDINTLRISFLQGLSLKAMARILDKSPGAVNKALTRFSIRPAKKNKCVWSLFPHKSENSKALVLRTRPLVSLRSTVAWHSKGVRMTQQKLDSHWVSLKDVINFLHEQRESVTVMGHGKEAVYYMNRRMVVPSQLLLKANQLRFEKKLAPFCVDSLTH